jgi:hypothetical protein
VGGFLSATTQPISVTEMGEQNMLGRNESTKKEISPVLKGEGLLIKEG